MLDLTNGIAKNLEAGAHSEIRWSHDSMKVCAVDSSGTLQLYDINGERSTVAKPPEAIYYWSAGPGGVPGGVGHRAVGQINHCCWVGSDKLVFDRRKQELPPSAKLLPGDFTPYFPPDTTTLAVFDQQDGHVALRDYDWRFTVIDVTPDYSHMLIRAIVPVKGSEVVRHYVMRELPQTRPVDEVTSIESKCPESAQPQGGTWEQVRALETHWQLVGFLGDTANLLFRWTNHQSRHHHFLIVDSVTYKPIKKLTLPQEVSGGFDTWIPKSLKTYCGWTREEKGFLKLYPVLVDFEDGSYRKIDLSEINGDIQILDWLPSFPSEDLKP